ncbi:UNVERIFIED_CONTAM: hypothetical protein HDU68_010849 [Siphonaria sp. JEL0065]|nr:hypothetical protein HDU68_010849 [Siphonaria sp. JEL0065]
MEESKAPLLQTTPSNAPKPVATRPNPVNKYLGLVCAILALFTLLPSPCFHSQNLDHFDSILDLPPVHAHFEFPATFPSFEVLSTGIGSLNITVSSSPTVATVQISSRLTSTAQIALDESVITASITSKNKLLFNATYPKQLADIGLYNEVNITFPAHFDLNSVYIDGNILSVRWDRDAPLVLSSFDAAVSFGAVHVESQLKTGVVGINLGTGSIHFLDLFVRESVVLGVESGRVDGTFKGFASFAVKAGAGEVHAFLSSSEKVDSPLYSLDMVSGVVKAIIGNFLGTFDASVGAGGQLHVGGGDPGSTPTHGTVGGKLGKGALEAKVEVGSLDLLFI